MFVLFLTEGGLSCEVSSDKKHCSCFLRVHALDMDLHKCFSGHVQNATTYHQQLETHEQDLKTYRQNSQILRSQLAEKGILLSDTIKYGMLGVCN